jgi:hypothetical protein
MAKTLDGWTRLTDLASRQRLLLRSAYPLEASRQGASWPLVSD